MAESGNYSYPNSRGNRSQPRQSYDRPFNPAKSTRDGYMRRRTEEPFNSWRSAGGNGPSWGTFSNATTSSGEGIQHGHRTKSSISAPKPINLPSMKHGSASLADTGQAILSDGSGEKLTSSNNNLGESLESAWTLFATTSSSSIDRSTSAKDITPAPPISAYSLRPKSLPRNNATAASGLPSELLNVSDAWVDDEGEMDYSQLPFSDLGEEDLAAIQATLSSEEQHNVYCKSDIVDDAFDGTVNGVVDHAINNHANENHDEASIPMHKSQSKLSLECESDSGLVMQKRIPNSPTKEKVGAKDQLNNDVNGRKESGPTMMMAANNWRSLMKETDSIANAGKSGHAILVNIAKDLRSGLVNDVEQARKEEEERDRILEEKTRKLDERIRIRKRMEQEAQQHQGAQHHHDQQHHPYQKPYHSQQQHYQQGMVEVRDRDSPMLNITQTMHSLAFDTVSSPSSPKGHYPRHFIVKFSQQDPPQRLHVNLDHILAANKEVKQNKPPIGSVAPSKGVHRKIGISALWTME